MDYSPPGPSVHGIFQAAILEKDAISFSRGSSWLRDQTQISGFAGRFFTTDPPGKPHSTLYFPLTWVCLGTSEKAMAPHSSTLAWKIPWTEEPGRLQSVGWLRVRHDWVTSLSLFTFMHWRRKWQPTPVFLPGESQGPRSLVGCHLRGRTELDTTEAT